MRCFTIAKYLRISNEDQDMTQAGKSESDSIANQRSLLEDFISRMPESGNAEVLEFCDDGWSGKNFERPAVREMLEQARCGMIQCIVVKDLSRFGRDYLTVGNYLSRVFPFMGIRFIAVNDGFDSLRPADIDSLEISFKTILYDLYSRDLSRKVRSAKKFRAQRGDFLSPFAPYGYVKKPESHKQLEIDPVAAGTVRRIFRLAGDGQTTMQIARILNEEQVPTPMLYKRAAGCSRTVWPCAGEENFWTHGTVTKILRDERYLGKNIYGKHTRDEVGKSHVVKTDRADWITVDGTHEGIVTQEEFDRAKEHLKKFAEHTGILRSNGSTLYKKVRCGVCGHIMARVNAKQPYYICRTSRVTSAYPCTEGRMLENDLMETILEGLHVQALYAVKAGRVWEEKRRLKMCGIEAAVKSISSLKKTCIGLESHMRELYEKFVLGELDKAGYLAAKAATVKRRGAAAAEIEKLETKLKNTSTDSRLKSKFADRSGQYMETEKLTVETVPDVLEEIIVYPDNRLHVIWNYQEDLKQMLFDIGTGDDSGGSL